MVDKKVTAKVEEEVKKTGASGSSKVALANKFIDQLTLKGDLRARYESVTATTRTPALPPMSPATVGGPVSGSAAFGTMWNDFAFTLDQHENPYKSSWAVWAW
jgi:hypothetical protein